MNVLKENRGFTLIETLVSINISLIAISLIFSFYLFAQKFSGSLSRNYTDKYAQMNFFNKLEKILENNDEYFVEIFNNKLLIITSNEDSICFTKDLISLNRIFEITKLDSINISIATETNEEITINNCEIHSGLSSSSIIDNTIKSSPINSISFEILYENSKYDYKIFNYPNSINRFQNINNNIPESVTSQ